METLTVLFAAIGMLAVTASRYLQEHIHVIGRRVHLRFSDQRPQPVFVRLEFRFERRRVFLSDHCDCVRTGRIFCFVQTVLAIAVLTKGLIAKALAIKFNALRVLAVAGDFASGCGFGNNRCEPLSWLRWKRRLENFIVGLDFSVGVHRVVWFRFQVFLD